MKNLLHVWKVWYFNFAMLLSIGLLIWILPRKGNFVLLSLIKIIHITSYKQFQHFHHRHYISGCCHWAGIKNLTVFMKSLQNKTSRVFMFWVVYCQRPNLKTKRVASCDTVLHVLGLLTNRQTPTLLPVENSGGSWKRYMWLLDTAYLGLIKRLAI